MADDTYYPRVVQAIPGPDRTIFVYFSDGRITRYDVEPLIEKGGVFARLRDDSLFENALTVLNGTAAWDVGGAFDPTSCIDIDPFTLYEAERAKDPLDSVA